VSKVSIFDRLLARRWLATAGLLAMTGVLGVFAARVKPDYSIEMGFPHFHKSRVDYERFKKDFPFEDAHAIVVIEAPDLFTPAGLARVAALEHDLGSIPGVVDTEGLTTVKDVVAQGESIATEKLFPRTDLPPDEIGRRRVTATTDPLFAWNLAPPDGRAAIIRVTLTRETARKDESRNAFLKTARDVLAHHAQPNQKLVLNGLPVIRSEFTELIVKDFRLMPLALVVIVILLFITFKSVADVIAALITIGFSIVWTNGVMGASHVPLQVLTNITPIIVMIVSLSDTIHIIAHYKELVGHGSTPREAIVAAMDDSAIPCLLTEVTIAGGFIALVANDIVVIQQFGLVTAAGMMLTWFANVTVLPIALSLLKPKGVKPNDASESAAARGFRRFVRWIEHMLVDRPRAVVVATVAIVAVSAVLASRAGREYYAYDDLRPETPLAKNLRYVEQVHGGTVPMAVFIEPPGDGARKPDAMLEPQAIALIDRIDQKLRAEFGDDVKNTSSLAKYLRKAHRLLAGEDVARESPLPKSRPLAAQELLAFDEPRIVRDFLAFDRGTASVYCDMPDRGSSHASAVIARLRDYFNQEEAATGYHVTLTGIFGVADGIYNSLVGGLAGSFAGALLVSFLIFCLVLRSLRLAAVALIPNVLPLVLTFAIMSMLRIDVKPSTVVIFSITLVIADDDTIQYLSRFRTKFFAAVRAGDRDPHAAAAIGTLRETGLPMFVTACAVSAGFLTMLASEFKALANLGLLIGVSLLSAVFADLFLSPLLLMKLRPRLAKEAKSAPPKPASAQDAL
jgi:predicted RND superfamily exporter protein